MAREIVRRQMVVLEGVGKRFDRTIDLAGDPGGTSLEPGTLTLDGVSTTFAIDVLDVDRENREIRIGLNIETPDPDLGRQTKTATFGISCFDFPMIDNTWLLGGQRCSVVFVMLHLSRDTSARFVGERSGQMGLRLPQADRPAGEPSSSHTLRSLQRLTFSRQRCGRFAARSPTTPCS